MIGSTILGTGINSMLGFDSRYGTDSSLGNDSIFESIPCDSDSGSCGPDPIPIPIQRAAGIDSKVESIKGLESALVPE